MVPFAKSDILHLQNTAYCKKNFKAKSWKFTVTIIRTSLNVLRKAIYMSFMCFFSHTCELPETENWLFMSCFMEKINMMSEKTHLLYKTWRKTRV